jgi:hypothetical protein
MESMSQITKAKKVYRFPAIPDGGSSRQHRAGSKTISGVKPGGDESPPSGIGPWRGARVAPQHCPILRPGHLKRRHMELIVAINNKRRT